MIMLYVPYHPYRISHILLFIRQYNHTFEKYVHLLKLYNSLCKKYDNIKIIYIRITAVTYNAYR